MSSERCVCLCRFRSAARLKALSQPRWEHVFLFLSGSKECCFAQTGAQQLDWICHGRCAGKIDDLLFSDGQKSDCVLVGLHVDDGDCITP